MSDESKTFRVEIIFKDGTRPKVVEVEDVYTKGDALRLQYPDDMIVCYPLANVFQWAYKHGRHCGSNRSPGAEL